MQKLNFFLIFMAVLFCIVAIFLVQKRYQVRLQYTDYYDLTITNKQLSKENLLLNQEYIKLISIDNLRKISNKADLSIPKPTQIINLK